MRCVIAGGGTGGHLFPGIAIAEAFSERERGNEVLFIGTERGIEVRVLTGEKFLLRTISAKPFKGKPLLGKAEAVWSIPRAILEALSILRDFRPAFVLGVGGYASGPALLAATLLGMKRAVHEQNMVPGMTNRLLRWFSHRFFVSFDETKQYFPERRTSVTGNPVRKEILASVETGKEAIRRKKEGRFTLLVFGGSTGAHRINEAMTGALDQLRRIRYVLKIYHQTGRGDVESVSKHYQEKGFDAVVSPFFKDMATCYQLSDLVICRSGASTITELAVCGKAAILIPYPHAAHQHQYLNAKKLVDMGAARMIRDEALDGLSLAKTILEIQSHPEEIDKMARAIKGVARPRAAQEIVDQCYALIRH